MDQTARYQRAEKIVRGIHSRRYTYTEYRKICQAERIVIKCIKIMEPFWMAQQAYAETLAMIA